MSDTYHEGVSGKSEVRELLEWELSLDSRDLRAHAWYHGNLTRQKAESLLEQDGDFLVRDCTSSGRPGDFVLSCRWNHANLHFLVHKDILQPDTIYEKLHYRFEHEHFDTVSDLITYHVGSGIPISAASGVLIHCPRTRTEPIYKSQFKPEYQFDGVRSDYVSLMRARSQPVAVSSMIEKISTLERMKQKSLNLTPPDGLLEALDEIPEHVEKILEEAKIKGLEEFKCSASSYVLSNFNSLLIPTCKDDVRMDASLIQTITTRLLETSDRMIALHLTKLDWDLLNGNSIDEIDPSTAVPQGSSRIGLFEKFFHNSQHRWNHVIERSLTFSHFVVLTILRSEMPERMINKWITIAGELKTSLGNIFSFSSIMRALLMPQITRSDGKINWMKLRQDFTSNTFNFETTLRVAFQGFVIGTESYPPNTTIPELLSTALILEDALELLPVSCISGGEENQLEFFNGHLEDVRVLSGWAEVQGRNIERHLQESSLTFDLVLTDIFRTELHLMILWGQDYACQSLKERCESLNKLF